MTQPALLLAVVLALAPADPPNQARQAPARDDAPPSVQDLHKLLADGDAAEVLKHVSRLLTLRGKAAQEYDRYELLTLKADAHLRLRAGDAAAAAFRLAAAEATGHREREAAARAAEQLIRRSRGLAYTPKKVARGARAEPLDIVQPEARKAALRALFADEMGELAPKAAAAREADTLPPKLKAIQAARELADLELAANGSADQVNGTVDELKQGAKDLLARAMEKSTKRVDQITTMANDTERVRRVVPGFRGFPEVEAVDKRRGLRRQDVTDLKKIADTCDEITAGAKALAQASGANGDEFEELAESADDLRMHVRRMLRAHDVEY